MHTTGISASPLKEQGVTINLVIGNLSDHGGRLAANVPLVL